MDDPVGTEVVFKEIILNILLGSKHKLRIIEKIITNISYQKD